MATTYRTDAGRGAARVSSEILDRLPPHNLDAEKGVLGSILLDPQMADDVAVVVRADDFYAEANQKLFAHLLAMHDEGGRIDATLLLERLTAAGDLELIGGAAYLAEVVHSVPHAANAVYYAEIVRDKATLRALIHASTEILRDAYEPTLDPREMLGRAEEMIFAVHDQRSTDQITTHPRPDGRGLRPHRRPHGRHGGGRRPHRLHRSRQSDRRPARLGIDRAGRPAQHGEDRPGHEYRRVRHHQVQGADVVREPGNGPARIGPADALLAGADRRQQVPQRIPFGRRPQEAGPGLGQAEHGPAVHRRHALPHLHRNRRLRPAAEAQTEPRAGGDRLPAIDPARTIPATSGRSRWPRWPGG